MHRNNNHGYQFIAHSLEEVAGQILSLGDLSIGAKMLKFLEKYIYEYPEQWYQWKKYADMEMIPSENIKVERPSPLSLLRPSLGKVSCQ